MAIELGGEDAKIIYFEGGNIEQRMNGICAGGTGSFIDQMASLLQTDATGLNEYARDYKAIYPIAARCGVFAKTDIQPLINDGATKEDLAVSIFPGPWSTRPFPAGLRQAHPGAYCLSGRPAALPAGAAPGLCPHAEAGCGAHHRADNSHLFAAIGSAMNAAPEAQVPLKNLAEKLRSGVTIDFEVARMEPLFASQERV